MGAPAIILGSVAAAKIASKLQKPLIKVATFSINFIKGRPRAAAKAQVRGDPPPVLGMIIYENVTQPIFAKFDFPLPGPGDVEPQVVKSLETGSFELTPQAATAVTLSGSVRSEVLSRITEKRRQEATGVRRVALDLAFFFL